MYKHNILFIGLDTHKISTEVAHIEDQRGAKPIHYGKVKTTKAAITKLARQYQSKYPQATLHFVYEASPCGYCCTSNLILGFFTLFNVNM